MQANTETSVGRLLHIGPKEGSAIAEKDFWSTSADKVIASVRKDKNVSTERPSLVEEKLLDKPR